MVEIKLPLQSLFPHASVLMHSCTLHSSGNISMPFNQPCLQGSSVLEHQSNMHIQQSVSCSAELLASNKSRKTRAAEVQRARYTNPSLIPLPSLCPVGNAFSPLPCRYA